MFQKTIPITPRPAERSVSTRMGAHNLTNKYLSWRKEMLTWYQQWVENPQSDFPDFIAELTQLPNGDFYRNLNRKDLALREGFYGWQLKAVFVLPRPKTVDAPLPFKSGDVDNYLKALVDALFEPLNSPDFNAEFERSTGEKDYFKSMKLNDAFIQSMTGVKRYTRLGTDENPHITFSIEQIRA